MSAPTPDLSQIPTADLKAEVKQREVVIRKTLGKWGGKRIIRTCPGCHVDFSTRNLRAHKCTLPWLKWCSNCKHSSIFCRLGENHCRKCGVISKP